MNDVEYERKKLIRNLVENKHFDRLIEELKQELAMNMLMSDDEKVRESFHRDAKALDRLVGKLVEIANEVRMING